MPELVLLALAAVAVLMFKHAVADFFLQTPYQYFNKGTYGHPGGILHAGIHVALTPLVYLVLAPASLALAAVLAVGEFVAHYHIDWLKEQIIRRNGWTVQIVASGRARHRSVRARADLSADGRRAGRLRGRLEQRRDFAIGEFEPVRQAV